MATRKRARKTTNRRGFGDSAERHASNATAWVRSVNEEVPHIEDAVEKGQCWRAYEGLLRLERKATLAGTHGAKSQNAALQSRATDAIGSVVRLGERFKLACVKRS